MQSEANPLLVVLYWAIRAYVWLIFIWALLTWIPGVAGSTFHNIIGLPVLPVINLFSFLRVGPIGLGAVVVALLLNFVANWIARKIVQQSSGGQPPAIEGDQP
ncbi:YggT family protein [bacterium]|nr:YggT family protein [bacterium]